MSGCIARSKVLAFYGLKRVLIECNLHCFKCCQGSKNNISNCWFSEKLTLVQKRFPQYTGLVFYVDTKSSTLIKLLRVLLCLFRIQ
jgi:hypothetical protein